MRTVEIVHAKKFAIKIRHFGLTVGFKMVYFIKRAMKS